MTEENQSNLEAISKSSLETLTEKIAEKLIETYGGIFVTESMPENSRFLVARRTETGFLIKRPKYDIILMLEEKN